MERPMPPHKTSIPQSIKYCNKFLNKPIWYKNVETNKTWWDQPIWADRTFRLIARKTYLAGRSPRIGPDKHCRLACSIVLKFKEETRGLATCGPSSFVRMKYSCKQKRRWTWRRFKALFFIRNENLLSLPSLSDKGTLNPRHKQGLLLPFGNTHWSRVWCFSRSETLRSYFWLVAILFVCYTIQLKNSIVAYLLTNYM